MVQFNLRHKQIAMERSGLSDGKYPIVGLSQLRVTLRVDNGPQWVFYSGDPDEFYKLFDLFKSKKLSFSEDAPMAILESGVCTRIEF